MYRKQLTDCAVIYVVTGVYRKQLTDGVLIYVVTVVCTGSS